MHQLHLPHIASNWGVLSDWHYPVCAGKRAREAGDEGDDEAGPSKQPRTGVSVCYFCLLSHAPQSSLLRAGACTCWQTCFSTAATCNNLQVQWILLGKLLHLDAQCCCWVVLIRLYDITHVRGLPGCACRSDTL